MSIEFFGTPLPPLEEEVIEASVRRLQCIEGIEVVRGTGRELGLSLFGESGSREDVTISFDRTLVYVGVHVGTRAQRDRIVCSVEKVLAEHGISIQLTED